MSERTMHDLHDQLIGSERVTRPPLADLPSDPIERLIEKTTRAWNDDRDRFDDLDEFSASMWSDEQLVWYVYQVDDDNSIAAWIMDDYPVHDPDGYPMSAGDLLVFARAVMNYWRDLTSRDNPTRKQIESLRRAECLVAGLTMIEQDREARAEKLRGAS